MTRMKKTLSDTQSYEQLSTPRSSPQEPLPATATGISLKYRADNLSSLDQVQYQDDPESKVWKCFERVFCFLKSISIYHNRRSVTFIIVAQAIITTFRVFPIILGRSFVQVIPVFVAYVTITLGWHGVRFLIPRFLFLYKIGMQLSILLDIIFLSTQAIQIIDAFRAAGSLSKSTGYLLNLLAIVLLFGLNILGLLFGWKLRRSVKAIRAERECVRETLADENGFEDVRRRLSTAFGDFQTSLKAISTEASVAEITTRTIEVGQTDRENTKYIPNVIRTSKYTYYNFLFVFLKMQFSRLANVFTTIIVILCFAPFSPVSPAASLLPLLIVFASAAVKDVAEDFKRKRADRDVNSKPAYVSRVTIDHGGTPQYQELSIHWAELEVGDIVHLKAENEIPVDLLLLATSDENGRCYVETSNLDGETSRKIRSVAPVTRNIDSAYNLLMSNTLRCECDGPSKNLFEFEGTLTLQNASESTSCPVSMENMILRGSDLRSSEWTLGLVVFTGHETRIALNSSETRLKQTSVEKQLNNMFMVIILVLFFIAVVCSLGNNNWQFNVSKANENPWYLQESVRNGYIFLSYVILFNNLIPLSLYVTMELVRFVFARYVDNDLAMYDEDSDTPAQARNSNVIEDLGQIQYIFSDKTGTLTRNDLVFVKCSIAGVQYGESGDEKTIGATSGASSKFYDAELLQYLQAMKKSDVEQPDHIHEFLSVLMLCNNIIPSCDAKTNTVVFQGSSPDEVALVEAAYNLGYKLLRRDGSICHCEVLGQPQTWEILALIEFTSERKRMSVVCRGPDGLIRVFCKGADSVLQGLLSTNQPEQVIHKTLKHLNIYASQGLRTLTVAMSYLEEDWFTEWAKRYSAATLSLTQRSEEIRRVSNDIEQKLILVGSTAIEDRLQEGAQECISALRQAGLKFWVLTGDKRETAISIGKSSKVIDDSMDIVALTETDKHSLRLRLEQLYIELVDEEKGSEMDSPMRVLMDGLVAAAKACWRKVFDSLLGRPLRQQHHKKQKMRLREAVDTRVDDTAPSNASASSAAAQVESTNEDGGTPSAFMYEVEDVESAMVIDGASLTLLLESDIKFLFLEVARKFKSVICCRCSPSQKADVVNLVTMPKLIAGASYRTLAIGDGANDVPMIQAATVGVGISGKEGRQAVLASDFSIAQFRFLQRLVFVHGNYSYKRITKLILFSFMKNVALSLSTFFLAFQTSFSGVLMYFSILFTLYNPLFTTIPIVILAMHDQDVEPSILMRHPILYRNGLESRSFNWTSFAGWCSLGVWHAFIAYVFPFSLDGYFTNYLQPPEIGQYMSPDQLGFFADGTAAYTILIVASMVQVSLLTSSWTRRNIIAVVGTLVFYFLFIWFLCQLYPWIKLDILESYNASGILTALAQEYWFWLGILCASLVAVLPNYILRAGRILFYPEPSHFMREWLKYSHDPLECREESRARPWSLDTGFAFSQDPRAPIVASTLC